MARFRRFALASAAIAALAASCVMDRVPAGLRRTPAGPGPIVRFDLSHRPLPEIPIPNDVATWSDPTSRTGLRVNASLVAPTAIEKKARAQFERMEGWGTFAPIWVSFDVDRTQPGYDGYTGPAIDLAKLASRHKGDDYDFANDAVYLVNLTTGVPVPLDLGNGNFQYTLRELDRYWPNDTRATERNLLFETIDETQHGAITASTFLPQHDSDMDGTLDMPNLDDPFVCPGPDPVCDNPADPNYAQPPCYDARRSRDRCIADHLLTYYERETDTLVLRPVLPLDEMTRYAVVITDRLVDGKGNAVRSPFDHVYHASMQATAERVRDVVNDPQRAAYFGDLAGTGLDHVAFTWSFTTQPTVDDMKRLRDGLFGKGPFARWEKQYPPAFELIRSVGLTAGLSDGATDTPGWQDSDFAKSAGCDKLLPNLFVIKYEDIKAQMELLLSQGFGVGNGPSLQLLLKNFENIDHILVGSFKSPFLLTGGPKGTDPNAAFDLDYVTGQGDETSDTVQFFLTVPKQTDKHKQPFDVNIYGHGYTGNFAELVFYAGNMAEHGLATIGINAMGHGFVLDDKTKVLATALLGGACVAPFYDALTASRARDLDNDGLADSGGDFWSSYLFHTRDGVRQSILDHLQLVRILRSLGGAEGQMLCRTEQTGWTQPATEPCDLNGDGKPEIPGDFDADGTPDIGGPGAHFGTWGESLGGILSGIHGAIDANVTTAVPGSGGGGLTDIGVRSFQGGVVEAVLLRIWGPLLVTVPAAERPPCAPGVSDHDHCTLCTGDQASLRWVMPDLNSTGEVEITCLDRAQIESSTVLVYNGGNKEQRCARIGSDLRLRVGIPASIGDKVQISIYDGKDAVKSYGTCELAAPGTAPKLVLSTWGKGRYANGDANGNQTQACEGSSCNAFQGTFFAEGDPLTAPAEGYGLLRQTPALRRFLTLAQAALDPGDPVSFAPYYSIKQMTDPSGAPIAPHAVLTLDTIGDMNVPLNSGIAFARAAGALPIFRPDQVAKYPEYANYATPGEIYAALGNRTPNQELIDSHVIEGITKLARHPAGPECAASANAKDPGGTFATKDGKTLGCYPDGCTPQSESSSDTRKCYEDTHCDFAVGKCVPNAVGSITCQEALFDADDLDEGTSRFFEQNAKVPHRLARYTEPATPETLDIVWQPRAKGVPFGPDGTWTPNPARPLTALLDAYIVPQGVHTFVNGEPCQSFDSGNYLTNLTARFFQTNGTDLYYLSHPTTHLCLTEGPAKCGYLSSP
jgi:hypothetical protein